MLSGRRKKDYAAETGADALEAQAGAFGAAAEEDAEQSDEAAAVA